MDGVIRAGVLTMELRGEDVAVYLGLDSPESGGDGGINKKPCMAGDTTTNLIQYSVAKKSRTFFKCNG
jgi:hypothetical protein